jgi:hypothetical protein
LFLRFIAQCDVATGKKFFPMREIFKFVKTFFCHIIHDRVFPLSQQPEHVEKRSFAFPIPNHKTNRGVIRHGPIFCGVKIVTFGLRRRLYFSLFPIPYIIPANLSRAKNLDV